MLPASARFNPISNTPEDRQRSVGGTLELRGVGATKLELHLLDRAAEAGGEHGRRRSPDLLDLLTEARPELVL